MSECLGLAIETILSYHCPASLGCWITGCKFVCWIKGYKFVCWITGCKFVCWIKGYKFVCWIKGCKFVCGASMYTSGNSMHKQLKHFSSLFVTSC